jgi:arginine decarboxylase
VIERPPGGRAAPTGGWGDRLYVVLSDATAAVAGQEAWAGIGWVQQRESGAGLFVEHHGRTEDGVRRDIELSLEAMCAARGLPFGEPSMELEGATCRDRPVTALVAAVFGSDPWPGVVPDASG